MPNVMAALPNIGAACGSLKMQHAKSRQQIGIWAPLHNFFGLCLCSMPQSLADTHYYSAV